MIRATIEVWRPMIGHTLTLDEAEDILHNVGRLARVFGTTWSVNAWVIAGILSVILAANYVAVKMPSLAGGKAAYALLIANLLAGAFIPVNTLLAPI